MALRRPGLAALRTLASVVVAVAIGTAAAAAERTLDATRRFPHVEGKRVVVDVADLDVDLRAADVAGIEVVTELRIAGVGADKGDRWIAARTPEFTDSEDQLIVSSHPGKSGFLALGHLTARARLRLVVPLTAIPDMTTTSGSITVRGDFPAAAPLRLRTATGSMELMGGAAALDIRTASGDANVEVLRPLEEFFARTSSGSVRLTGGARQAEVDTASGDVRLANLSGPAVVATSTGKITLRWDRLDGQHTVRVRSSSGRVSLTLPETCAPRGHLTTTGGTIRCDFPGTLDERGDTVKLSGSGPTVEAETASGDIVLSTG